MHHTGLELHWDENALGKRQGDWVAPFRGGVTLMGWSEIMDWVEAHHWEAVNLVVTRWTDRGGGPEGSARPDLTLVLKAASSSFSV